MRDRHYDQIKEGCKETLALPLVGVPLGVKDNLCTKGVPTTAASRILEGYRPSYDATVVSKLKQAGGIVVRANETSGEETLNDLGTIYVMIFALKEAVTIYSMSVTWPMISRLFKVALVDTLFVCG